MTNVDELVRQTIMPQLELALQASRRRPLPAAPSAELNEPGHGELFLRQLLRSEGSTRPSAEPLGTLDGGEGILEPATATVTELLAAFSAGALTPSALVRELAPRWSERGPSSAAVLAHVPGVEAAAAESDGRWAAGTARPLEGVPFAIKDIIDVEGAMVTCGSQQTGDRIAAADATVVARLRAAGAIPVFMAATSEFACGAPDNGRYGPVPNPWDYTRWTGGSSTGSAAAIAAGLTPLALGTDTAGSVRVPSALCGTTGIKPTYGLVPRTGVASLSWTLDHVGPMARSAEDLAVVLAVIAGPDGIDPTAGELVPRLDVDPTIVAGLRIGVPRTWFTERCDADVLAAYDRAVLTFVGLGAEVVDIEFDDLEAIHDESWNVFYAELASNQEANAGRMDRFDAGTKARLDCGFVPLATDYLRALRRRPLIQRDMLARMDAARVDVLLTPGIGATAPRLVDLVMAVDGVEYNLHDVIPRNTRIFDYTGFPAIMAPSGLASDGLPVGIQIVARPWQDRLCLSAAIAFQLATDHHRNLPAIAASGR